MKSAPQLDIATVADAVIDELEQRKIAENAHHAAEYAHQERENALANARAAQARRTDLESRISIVQVEQTQCHARCLTLESELKALPGQLLLERRKQSVLLGELARLQQQLAAN